MGSVGDPGFRENFFRVVNTFYKENVRIVRIEFFQVSKKDTG